MIDNPSQYLPETLQQVLDAIGYDATLLLVNEYGGSYLYIPVKAAEGHALAALLGLDKLKNLTALFQGEDINVPRCVELLRAMRDDTIWQTKQSGVSNRLLARRNTLTDRHIRRIVKKQRDTQDDPQDTLF